MWLQSLRSRPAVVALLFALSATAVLTSALGPLLIRAVHQSSLSDAVAAAGPTASSVAVSLELSQNDDLDEAVDEVGHVFDGVSYGEPTSLWQRPRLTVQTTSSVGWAPTGSADAETVARVASGEEGCAGLLVTSGRCPLQAGETLVSVGDASLRSAAPGTELMVPLLNGRFVTLRVVGLYDPDRSVAALDLLRPSSVAGELARVTGDPLITTRRQLTAFGAGASVVERLLLVDSLDVKDEAVARSTVSVVQAGTLAVTDRLVVFESQLPELLDDVDRGVSSAAVLMLVTVVQAEALALLALIIGLQRLGASRSAEWGVGRLRGMPRPVWLRSIWAEPAAALLLGLPVGLVGAVGVASVAVGRALRPGTPVEWSRWPVLAAAGGVTLAALVALLAVSLRDLRRPLIEVLQQSADSRRLSPVGLVAQSAVVLLAATALYQLLVGGVLNGRGSQLALLAPALFAFATAILAVRLAVLIVRRVTARPPRTLVGLVVGRHAARSPSTLTPAVVVATALALTVFSTQLLALSVRNQGLRAQAIVGADTVLQVSRPEGVDLVQAVRTADPSGRYAMAAQERAASSDGGTSRIVAVDAARLEAVSPWVARWSETDSLAQALHPATAEPVLLRGSQVELHTTDVTRKLALPEGYPPPLAAPGLSLVVQSGDGPWQDVSLGALKAGPAEYRADLPCPSSCRLVGIDVTVGKGKAYDATFTIDRLQTDREPASSFADRLSDPQGWHERIGRTVIVERSESVTPTASAAGLTIHASDLDGGNTNRVIPADVDDPLPALVAPGITIQPFPGLPLVANGTGLDGQSQLIKVVGRAAILPRALDDGVLVDLRDAQALSDPADDEATNEVWMTRTAPPSVERSLAEQGVVVLGREYLDDTRDALLEQGNTRGAESGIWVAAASLLITLITLVGARSTDGRRRRLDWSAMQDAGMSPRSSALFAFVEIAVPPLLGIAIGVASGLAAVVLGAPRFPLVDVYTPGPPLDLQLAWTPLLWIAAGAALVTLAIAALGALVETRPKTRP